MKFSTGRGWTHTWVSFAGSDFNHDYQVSFSRDEPERGVIYHDYKWMKPSMTELPGISVFYRDADGTVYHTHSCYARGLEFLSRPGSRQDLK
jgi:predicted dithiol-disulfide oxidoreductase (DUF899 family)